MTLFRRNQDWRILGIVFILIAVVLSVLSNDAVKEIDLGDNSSTIAGAVLLLGAVCLFLPEIKKMRPVIMQALKRMINK